jgi:hypothetical protein
MEFATRFDRWKRETIIHASARARTHTHTHKVHTYVHANIRRTYHTLCPPIYTGFRLYSQHPIIYITQKIRSNLRLSEMRSIKIVNYFVVRIRVTQVNESTT